MVSKHYHKIEDDLNGGPPPPDDSWWDAVLAEESQERAAAPRQSGVKTREGETNSLGGEMVQVDWRYAQSLYEQDRVVELHVCGFNRGGLLVDGDRLHGFVPVSHLVSYPLEKSAGEQERFLKDCTGKTMPLKVIECDPERGRVVFSERAALSQPGTRNQLFHQLQRGQCVDGVVTNITDFGVFIDLGGVEGLVHVSELSWGRVRHPADVVAFGERVHVHVINVDADRSRVALSIKRLYSNPWETAEQRYLPGQIAEGVITSIVPFGAFARLEEGLDGLIHVSEITANGEGGVIEDVLQEGQHVRVRVIQVDAARQRLGLSLVKENE
ncbi:MAG: S1 RNA-binding domain-containing protein [Chloroflexi bacterium]|nr:S1 RNA-binding domain-containing protein [Chloroflexota bacterium]